MIALTAALGLLMAQTAEPAWTWSLYDADDEIVLANDVPDTANLRATLECDRGAGVARIATYGADSAGGMATLRSGTATAATEAESGRRGRLQTALRIDHPAFAAFVETGTLSVTVAANQRRIEVQPEHLAKLRRFAELCGG